jgi:hypothetical protein
LNKFYKSTKHFWTVSRIILTLLFSVAILDRITETDLPNLIVNIFFLIIIFSMIMLIVVGILKKKAHYSLRFVVGISMILFGFLISYLLLTLGKIDYPLHVKIGIQLLPIWIISYGFYEITKGISSLRTVKAEV